MLFHNLTYIFKFQFANISWHQHFAYFTVNF